MIWFVVFLTNSYTGAEWYEMMSQDRLERDFENWGDYFQCSSNANVTLQIMGQSRDFCAACIEVDRLRKES